MDGGASYHGQVRPRGTGHMRRVSVQDAAPILGVSVFMVRALIRQRRLPYYKIGRRVVLDVADLEAYLLAHRVDARER